MKALIFFSLIATTLCAQHLPSRLVLDSAGNYVWKRGKEHHKLTINLTPDGSMDGKAVSWSVDQNNVRVTWNAGRDWLTFPSQSNDTRIEGESSGGKITLERTPWNGAGVRLQGSTFGGRKVDNLWQVPWGSYNRDFHSTHGVVFKLSTLNRIPSVVRLHWGWAIKKNNIRIKNGGSEVIVVKPGIDTVFFSPEGTFTENRTKLADLGVDIKEGEKYIGWVAQLIDEDNKVSSIAVSLPELKAFAEKGWK